MSWGQIVTVLDRRLAQAVEEHQNGHGYCGGENDADAPRCVGAHRKAPMFGPPAPSRNVSRREALRVAILRGALPLPIPSDDLGLRSAGCEIAFIPAD